MVTLCSHLFWPRDIPPPAVEGEEVEVPEQRYADCDRVLECMQRSLKIASVCNPNLFVEILDRLVTMCMRVVHLSCEGGLERFLVCYCLTTCGVLFVDIFSISKTTTPLSTSATSAA